MVCIGKVNEKLNTESETFAAVIVLVFAVKRIERGRERENYHVYGGSLAMDNRLRIT